MSPLFLPDMARFISSTEMENIPKAVVANAKLVIMDCIGAIVGGMAEPDMQALVNAGQQDGQATILGTDGTADPQTAAFLNGMAGTVLEMDEGSQFARGHPGMHVFPALLAAAQEIGATGTEFLRAFIIGYDVAARAGIGTRLRMSMHPHGTWGTLGAAGGLERRAGCRITEHLQQPDTSDKPQDYAGGRHCQERLYRHQQSDGPSRLSSVASWHFRRA